MFAGIAQTPAAARARASIKMLMQVCDRLCTRTQHGSASAITTKSRQPGVYEAPQFERSKKRLRAFRVRSRVCVFIFIVLSRRRRRRLCDIIMLPRHTQTAQLSERQSERSSKTTSLKMPPRHVLSFGRVFARVHDGGSCLCVYVFMRSGVLEAVSWWCCLFCLGCVADCVSARPKNRLYMLAFACCVRVCGFKNS